MKSKKYLYISLVIFIIAGTLPYKKGIQSLINPLPTGKNTKAFPRKKVYSESTPIQFTKDISTIKKPDIRAKSAIVIDVNDKKILYEKNAYNKRPVASLVKMMTAIVTYEYLNLDDTVKISVRATKIGENSMGLKSGEELTVEDLLYGLILNSANDAAVALAERTSGNELNFVQLMNQKAKLLGAENTLFIDSSGLNLNKGNYYSTAEDMAKIAYYSQVTHAELKKIYKTLEKKIPATPKHGYKLLKNQTNLLRTYPGVQGMKTGYTEESGLSLVSYAINQNKKVIVVILNSPDRRRDAILLLDFAYKSLGIPVKHNLL